MNDAIYQEIYNYARDNVRGNDFYDDIAEKVSELDALTHKVASLTKK